MGFRLFSLDHETGKMRLDARGEWGGGDGKEAKGKRKQLPPSLELVPVPRDELLDPAADASWLSSQVDCGVEDCSVSYAEGEGDPAGSVPPPGAQEEKQKKKEKRGEGGEEDAPWPVPATAAARAAGTATQWLPAGGDALLALSPSASVEGTELLEYSARLRCPVGFVLDKLPRDRGELRARLVDSEGEEVFPRFSSSSGSDSGSDGEGSSLAAQEAAAARAAAVEVVVASTGEVVGRRGRNSKGSFYHVYQPNKWRKKVAELEAEALRASAAVV